MPREDCKTASKLKKSLGLHDEVSKIFWNLYVFKEMLSCHKISPYSSSLEFFRFMHTLIQISTNLLSFYYVRSLSFVLWTRGAYLVARFSVFSRPVLSAALKILSSSKSK